MNAFCHNCGQKLIIAAKFCPHCGTSQASLNEKPPVEIKPKAQTTFTPRIAGADEDDDPVDHIQSLDIRLNALEVDIKGFESIAKETVGGLMKEGIAIGPTVTQAPASRGSNLSSNQKEFLEQFRKEAGAIKPGDSINIG